MFSLRRQNSSGGSSSTDSAQGASPQDESLASLQRSEQSASVQDTPTGEEDLANVSDSLVHPGDELAQSGADGAQSIPEGLLESSEHDSVEASGSMSIASSAQPASLAAVMHAQGVTTYGGASSDASPMRLDADNEVLPASDAKEELLAASMDTSSAVIPETQSVHSYPQATRPLATPPLDPGLETDQNGAGSPASVRAGTADLYDEAEAAASELAEEAPETLAEPAHGENGLQESLAPASPTLPPRRAVGATAQPTPDLNVLKHMFAEPKPAGTAESALADFRHVIRQNEQRSETADVSVGDALTALVATPAVRRNAQTLKQSS